MGPGRWKRRRGASRHAQRDALACGRTEGDWEDQDCMGQKSDIDRDGGPSFATNSQGEGVVLMDRDGPFCRLFKR
jgi:hypothetical protein